MYRLKVFNGSLFLFSPSLELFSRTWRVPRAPRAVFRLAIRRDLERDCPGRGRSTVVTYGGSINYSSRQNSERTATGEDKNGRNLAYAQETARYIKLRERVDGFVATSILYKRTCPPRWTSKKHGKSRDTRILRPSASIGI